MESKGSTVFTMIKGIGTGSIIAVLMIATMLLLQGCHISFSSFGSKNIGDDGLMQELDGKLDKADIEFLGYRTDEYKDRGEIITKYSFVMTDTNADVSNDLLTIYETANEVLKTEEYDGKKVSIEIYTHSVHSEKGYPYVATFKNFDEDGRICDYICNIRVEGIDDESKGFTSGMDYDVNSKEYWSQFEGEVTFFYTDNVS